MIEYVKISEDKSKLDREMIFKFLNEEARWCKGILREIVERSIDNSLCIVAYDNSKQAGFGKDLRLKSKNHINDDAKNVCLL